jgi:hypothetical protein
VKKVYRIIELDLFDDGLVSSFLNVKILAVDLYDSEPLLYFSCKILPKIFLSLCSGLLRVKKTGTVSFFTIIK